MGGSGLFAGWYLVNKPDLAEVVLLDGDRGQSALLKLKDEDLSSSSKAEVGPPVMTGKGVGGLDERCDRKRCTILDFLILSAVF